MCSRRYSKRRGIRGLTPLLLLAIAAAAPPRVDVLKSSGGVPAHLAGLFIEPINFQQSRDGTHYVFDRRAHTVYRIDEALSAAIKIVQIGQEEGRIIEPTAFDLDPGGTFVVADAPNNVERVQLFGPDGTRLGGFTLPGRAAPRITLGSVVLNGLGSLQFTGRSILMNQPESGALFMEFGLSGTPLRNIGLHRPTGHEHDRDVHLALNVGLPLAHPKGGFYFVFQAGVPMFRRYDGQGRLLYERHVEGPELDGVLAAMPTSWPRRGGQGEGRELPLILPTVRTAAVDRDGNLWIALAVPYTYVYDSDGDKRRTVQFNATGIVSPTSLFFTPDGRLLVTPGCYEFNVGTGR
ncbi:MAG: hypothetical protein ACRD09_11675 [Vicinamibacterales bacterium]